MRPAAPPGGVQLLEPSDSGGGAVLPAQPASATSSDQQKPSLHFFASADSDATRAAMFWVKATRPVLSAATIAS